MIRGMETQTTTPIRFTGSVKNFFNGERSGGYPEGTTVKVLSKVVHDGVCLVRFPGGEETYLSISRLSSNPGR